MDPFKIHHSSSEWKVPADASQSPSCSELVVVSFLPTTGLNCKSCRPIKMTLSSAMNRFISVIHNLHWTTKVHLLNIHEHERTGGNPEEKLHINSSNSITFSNIMTVFKDSGRSSSTVVGQTDSPVPNNGQRLSQCLCD